MDWIESVKELRSINNKNRLVIFVGAGISKNSGMPLWGELIKKIALEIKYSKCETCKQKTSDCIEDKCDFAYDYNSGEYLSIPEYFYDMDKSKGKKKYYDFLKKEMYVDVKPNALDDMIFDIFPHHVITTNYDFLLEKSNSINVSRYTVVKNDKDLLSDENEHYIIKMHGSLDNMRTVVLKESDYIDYENNHPLISTIIKALLLNHSFLFLGYSLNDYNLKLIMGWINYFRKLHNEKGIKHYLYATSEYSEFEKTRLEENNIFVINGESIPQKVIDAAEVSSEITFDGAKKLYAFLKCINRSDIWQKYCGLKEIVDEIYDLYSSYKKIAMVDLVYLLPFGRVELYGNTLLFYDNNYYEFKEELKSNHKLKDLFIRAHIFTIQLLGYDDKEYYELIGENEISYDDNFNRALLNDYNAIVLDIKSSNCIAEQIYYYKFLGSNSLLSVLKKSNTYKDYVDYILVKMRQRIALLSYTDRQQNLTEELRDIFQDKQSEYKKCVYQLEDLFGSTSQDRYNMSKLLENTEKRYGIGFSGTMTGGPFIELQKIQGYVYNYYYFFKLNYLPLDIYTDPVTYFETYIKAMLCTYFKAPQNNFEMFCTAREEYVLKDIDFDIITKYTIPKMLLGYIDQYSANKIKLSNRLLERIYIQFKNLCESFIKFHTEVLCRYIHSTVIVLQNSDGINMEDICEIVYETLKKTSITGRFSNNLIEIIIYILSNNMLSRKIKNKILRFMLNKETYNSCCNNEKTSNYNRIVSLLSDSLGIYKSNTLFEELILENDTKKMFQFRTLLPKTKVNSFFEKNISDYNVFQITSLFFERRIKYNLDIQKIYIDAIEKTCQNKGFRVYLNSFENVINNYLILDLLNIEIDLSLIWKYKNESVFVEFVSNPEKFDYSKVNIKDYMWQNYIYSEKYKGYFINNKNSIISEKVKSWFSSNRADAEQQKIVYGILLDDKELRRFPSGY